MKKIIWILVFEIAILTLPLFPIPYSPFPIPHHLLPITHYQSPDLVYGQPPRVKYKEKVPATAPGKSAPAISQEKPEPEVKVTIVPKKLSPHFSEFVVEAEILNAEITKVSFRLFGKISGMVKLEIKEIDFSLEGLADQVRLGRGENKIFYRGYDLGCPHGGVKGVSIYFRVAKNWLTEKNITPEKVSLSYYTKGEISTLASERINEDENYVYFLSKTDKLGIFLILAEK